MKISRQVNAETFITEIVFDGVPVPLSLMEDFKDLPGQSPEEMVVKYLKAKGVDTTVKELEAALKAEEAKSK